MMLRAWHDDLALRLRLPRWRHELYHLRPRKLRTRRACIEPFGASPLRSVTFTT